MDRPVVLITKPNSNPEFFFSGMCRQKIINSVLECLPVSYILVSSVLFPFLHFKSVKSDWIALILSFCLLQSKNNDRLYFKVDCFWTKICDSDHCV